MHLIRLMADVSFINIIYKHEDLTEAIKMHLMTYS